jgi:hypothetical protein
MTLPPPLAAEGLRLGPMGSGDAPARAALTGEAGAATPRHIGTDHGAPFPAPEPGRMVRAGRKGRGPAFGAAAAVRA